VNYFSSGSVDQTLLTPGTPVIVDTGKGAEYGIVTVERPELDAESLGSQMRKVMRLATPQDSMQEEANRTREAEARITCQEKINHHGLGMHLVNVEVTFDLSKIVFYFTADGRVDFRELVKDLAATFRMRIELRQIGARDEARMLNGIGICGCTLCCGSFLNEFQPVSIKSAKDQGLSLNPTKISGVCGKLMCCLKYEEETYDELSKTMPGVGDKVRTPDGDGYVIAINTLRQTARVAVHVKNQDDTKTDNYQAGDIQVLERAVQCDRGCSCNNCRRH